MIFFIIIWFEIINKKRKFPRQLDVQSTIKVYREATACYENMSLHYVTLQNAIEYAGDATE